MYLTILLAIFVVNPVFAKQIQPSCNSSIYCYGQLLHTVQLSRAFADSKTFVDKKLLRSPEETLRNFARFLKTNPKPDRTQVLNFVNGNFADGNELEPWTPTDYRETPEFLHQVPNGTLREFVQKLVKLWPALTRKIKDEVSVNPERYSIIPVPNCFVVPGGRFREYYYWDSYWVIRSLLISDMHQTARGMIDNFFTLVDRFGFVPNGGRKYYLNRSQPPFLTAMAFHYYKTTSDLKWLKDNIGYLERELLFWLNNRAVSVKNVTLAHYEAVSSGPRPESYLEDFETASGSQQVYTELKSGAESGWDFSSRWLFDSTGGTQTTLKNIQTSRVVPVDLNAILCGAFKTISGMFLELNNKEKSDLWNKMYDDWRFAMDTVFWHEEDGTWYDYDKVLNKPRKYFYPSNVAPLWAKCYDPADANIVGGRVAAYLKKKGILGHLGGVPTSLEQTGEQWDFPNAWPPLQDIVVEGLRSTGNAEAVAVAKQLAQRWVNANLIGFSGAGEMFEKYDAVTPGQYGGGGEYVVQTGFGWSNGVVLKFIYEYFRNL